MLIGVSKLSQRLKVSQHRRLFNTCSTGISPSHFHDRHSSSVLISNSTISTFILSLKDVTLKLSCVPTHRSLLCFPIDDSRCWLMSRIGSFSTLLICLLYKFWALRYQRWVLLVEILTRVCLKCSSALTQPTSPGTDSLARPHPVLQTPVICSTLFNYSSGV